MSSKWYIQAVRATLISQKKKKMQKFLFHKILCTLSMLFYNKDSHIEDIQCMTSSEIKEASFYMILFS